ncbi:hypothetical protein GALMADRAFT_280469 [Galerina marginata CBS 339.88]|uniref:MARVEL domain-containing protein n=1 Tax=Galerina marginata (strain CBS 339.88) TaxID=685588 RepID=A0A067SUY6_GALM3|nr:hypothetical protein GALMADRAFT_280469 [Galerina marginata CBS 339.88]
MNHNGYAAGPGVINRSHVNGHRHRIARLLLSALLFACSAVLLGLTARRIHFTRNALGQSEGIVDELLATSIVALIASLLLIRALTSTAVGFTRKMIEFGTLFLVWLMSLIGAVILTRNWHPLGPCGSATNECTLQKATIAFAWIVFALSSVLLGLRLLNWHWDQYDGNFKGRGNVAEPGTAATGTAPMTTTTGTAPMATTAGPGTV